MVVIFILGTKCLQLLFVVWSTYATDDKEYGGQNFEESEDGRGGEHIDEDWNWKASKREQDDEDRNWEVESNNEIVSGYSDLLLFFFGLL